MSLRAFHPPVSMESRKTTRQVGPSALVFLHTTPALHRSRIPALSRRRRATSPPEPSSPRTESIEQIENRRPDRDVERGDATALDPVGRDRLVDAYGLASVRNTVIAGLSDAPGFWNTICIRRPVAGSRTEPSARPSSATEPPVAGLSPAIARASKDFPRRPIRRQTRRHRLCRPST